MRTQHTAAWRGSSPAAAEEGANREEGPPGTLWVRKREAELWGGCNHGLSECSGLGCSKLEPAGRDPPSGGAGGNHGQIAPRGLQGLLGVAKKLPSRGWWNSETTCGWCQQNSLGSHSLGHWRAFLGNCLGWGGVGRYAADSLGSLLLELSKTSLRLAGKSAGVPMELNGRWNAVGKLVWSPGAAGTAGENPSVSGRDGSSPRASPRSLLTKAHKVPAAQGGCLQGPAPVPRQGREGWRAMTWRLSHGDILS